VFARAEIELSIPQFARSRSAAGALVEPLFSAAGQCRQIMRKPAYSSSENASALAAAAGYLEKQARWRLETLKNSSYTVGERSTGGRGDDDTRAKVRALAAGTHRIFGKFLYGTFALIATVALQIEVDKSDVSNLCSDLPVKAQVGRLAKAAGSTPAPSSQKRRRSASKLSPKS